MSDKSSVLEYIDVRKKKLRLTKMKHVLREPPKRREMIRQRYNGRVFELERLEKLLRSCTIETAIEHEWKEFLDEKAKVSR